MITSVGLTLPRAARLSVTTAASSSRSWPSRPRWRRSFAPAPCAVKNGITSPRPVRDRAPCACARGPNLPDRPIMNFESRPFRTQEAAGLRWMRSSSWSREPRSPASSTGRQVVRGAGRRGAGAQGRQLLSLYAVEGITPRAWCSPVCDEGRPRQVRRAVAAAAQSPGPKLRRPAIAFAGDVAPASPGRVSGAAVADATSTAATATKSEARAARSRPERVDLAAPVRHRPPLIPARGGQSCTAWNLLSCASQPGQPAPRPPRLAMRAASALWRRCPGIAMRR